MKKITIGFLGLGIILLSTFVGFSKIEAFNPSYFHDTKNIYTKDGITVEFRPIELGQKTIPTFAVSLNTHFGSIDYDLTKIVYLEDEKDNKYFPAKWVGDAPGGQHRKGKLFFPALRAKSDQIKIVFVNDGGRKEGELVWDLTN